MLTLLCAVCSVVWGAEAERTVTMQYTGSTTINMNSGNNAALVGLSETDWSVACAKGGASNLPGLNKDGTIRLYFHTNGGNTITVSSQNGTINSIKITFGDLNNAYVKVGDNIVEESDGSYSIGASEFVIGNANSSNIQVHIKSIEITYTPGSASGKTDPIVNFASESMELEVGENVKNSITNSNNVELSFDNETPSVATYDTETELVTALAEGETTITASWEETDDYYGGSKSFTVKVNPASKVVTFEKVTNANQLVAGNEFILVASEKEKAKAMSGVSSNGNFRNSNDITINNNKIQIKESEVAVLTIGGTSGAYTFKASDNNLYLAINTEGNNLQSSDNASAASSQWSVGSDFSLTNKSYSTRYIAYNKTSPRFATYTSGQEKAVLYVKEGYKTDDNILKNPDLSIEDVRMALDDGETELEVTTLSDGAISFETSDEDVASIEERDGKYYVVAAGSGICKITATQEETDEYASATITFKVYVTGEKASGVYKRVTSTSELVAGKQYIIVAPDDNVAMGGSSSNGNYRVNIKAKVLEIGSEGAANQYVTITDNDPVTMLTLGGQSGAWTLLTYDNLDYLSVNSDGNSLQTASSVTNKSSWTITINDDLSQSITNNEFTSRSIRYNSGSGQERFACYKSGMKDAVLFVKVESIPVAITSVGYATLYYSDKNLIVPSGVVATTVELTTAGDNIQTSRTYEAGKIIPKDCGVLLEALNKDENTQTFFFAEGITSDTADPNNLLYGLDEDGTTVGPDDSKDYIFYMLSTDKNGENVGFYWKNGGAPFTTKAHKAYLAIPKSSNINVSSFVFDDLTGIRAITGNVSQDAEGVYTLSGIRVNGNQLPKGIYIVNGKKVVIK